MYLLRLDLKVSRLFEVSVRLDVAQVFSIPYRVDNTVEVTGYFRNQIYILHSCAITSANCYEKSHLGV